MLQRIQSIYLFLVFVFAILFVMLPLAYFPAEAPEIPFRLSKYNIFYDALGDLSGHWIALLLLGLFALGVFLTIYTSFQYKDRLFQIRLGKYNMLVHAAMILVAFFLTDNLRNQVHDAGFSYGPGIFFPIISLIFVLLANRAIKKDEEMVRSADRIR